MNMKCQNFQIDGNAGLVPKKFALAPSDKVDSR